MTIITDEDRKAARACIENADEDPGIAEAFARHREQAQREALEEAAKVAMHYANARRAAQADANARKAKIEARGFKYMAMEATQIECAIRAMIEGKE